jgi:hypothetical protein
MARMRRKPDLPVKTCATCGRPMVWRRKWARVWDAVRHCSERCRRAPPTGMQMADKTGDAAHEPQSRAGK